MSDAWGSFPNSGILEGNLQSLGSARSCREVDSGTFKGRYCSARFLQLEPGDFLPDKVDVDARGRVPGLWFDPWLDKVFGGPFEDGMTKYAAMYGECFPDSCSDSDVVLINKAIGDRVSAKAQCPNA